MDTDPAASMRCWEIVVELGGRQYVIPAQPAADWWPVLVSGDPQLVLDMLPSNSDLDDDLVSGAVSMDDLGEAIVEAIEEAAGRSFHASLILAAAAGHAWPVLNGRLARYGFRWDVMPLGAALDALYSLIVETMDDKHRTQFLALLDNEVSSGKPSRRTRERVAAEFEEFAGPKPTDGVRSTGARSGSARPRTQRRPRPPLPDDPSPAPTTLPGPPAGSDPPASS